MIRRELNLLFLTFQYYSRIPTPRTEYSEEALSRAFRYFPLVGAAVGSIGALAVWGGSFFLPGEVAIFLAIILMTLTTGAIHEDGFSDTFDGFGGGYDRERILEIMRDSTSGVFGVVSLILLFGFQFLMIRNLPFGLVPGALVAAETSSRVMPLFFINTADYARKDFSKGMHTRKKLSLTTLLIATAVGLCSLSLIPWQAVLPVMALYGVIFAAFRHYVLRKLSGYTGDTLGALIVLCRLALYFILITIIPLL